MRIILVRHGQTDLNVQKRLQGSSEIPLNERGREQARETHEFVVKNGLVPTKILSSPLGRAIETGAVIAGIDISGFETNSITAINKPAEIEIEPNLIEMSFGIYEQKNMEKENPEFLAECFDHPEGYKPPEGAECYDEVVARAERVIERLRTRIALDEFSEDDIIMLVSHGALSHGIFEYLKKTPREKYWDVDFNNCAIAEIFLSSDGKSDDYKFISNGFEKNW
ncbi:histidine phosphatase family protein [Pseudobutyrivibrio xylanivorans]|uniref:Histidine phosphatase family protein n=1 Tax=Pseudobutyrivibrio xylanivorans TaxID=185007 RepID=A0A5P6VPG6_PSEXY|nr:histidine phosphatase family protein [Pseudobutyrivibrio xylanivorans]QFJ54573.1 histidine phosphatase family protein [Pseudobutyrivibrio xylanivorans]